MSESEPTSPCSYVEQCALFNEFKDAQAKAVWMEVYCLGVSQVECERRKLREAGQPVPSNLLPSGHLLDRTPR